ncbi:MAG: HD domain-containing protein [Patescibacteria group bacterium]
MNAKSKYLDFFRVVGRSKRIPRTGWVREKMKNPESVAEHSFRVSVIAMVLADELDLNKEKLMKMALIHDLGETFTGDIVWTRGEAVDIRIRENKEKEELKNLIKLFSMIKDGIDYIDIFQEMLSDFSKEAQIFWQIDKLEMAIQAYEYEQEQGINLEEFFLNAGLFIKDPILKEIFEEVLAGRVGNKKEYAEL